uniref:RING-type E3 ubiquitin transferase n=1 Tax=Strongyloides venezuelensis TaxID=75913 RepID=A0A0K0FUJ8_STRVS
MDNIYYCHNCREAVRLSATDIVCSKCNGGFVEPLQDYHASNPNGPRAIPLFTSNIPSGSGIRGATAIFDFPANISSFGPSGPQSTATGENGGNAGSDNSRNPPTNRLGNFSLTDIVNAFQTTYGQNLPRNNREFPNTTPSETNGSNVHTDGGSGTSSTNNATIDSHQPEVSVDGQQRESTNPGTANNTNNQSNDPNNTNVFANLINNVFPRIIAAQGLHININNSDIPTPPNTTNNSESSTTNATNANNSPNHQERNEGGQNQQQQRTGLVGLLSQLNNIFNRRNQQNPPSSEVSANVSISQSNPNNENTDTNPPPTTEGENTEQRNSEGGESNTTTTGRRPEIGRLVISLQGSNDGIVLNVAPDDRTVSLSTEDLISSVTEVLRNAMSTGSENLSTELNTTTFQNIVRDITRLIDDPQRGNILDVSGNGITLGIGPNEHVFEGILRMVENIDEVAHARRNRLSEVEVARIPIVEVTEEQEKNESQCTVCMDTFVKKELVYKLACKHIFHKQCLNPWVQSHRSCPVCRQEIKPYDFPDPVPEENYTDDMELD